MIDIAKYREQRLLKEQKRKEQLRQESNPILSNINKLKNGCWEWKGPFLKKGYGRIMFNGKSQRAHRVAYLLHFGPYDPQLLVCHNCDNPKCVNPAHLFLGTAKDNFDDAMAKGRQTQVFEKGNKPAHSSIPDKLAGAIKYSIGKESKYFSLKQIADIYEVPHQLVKDIKRGRSYAHVL
jgi:Pectobacterium phage endonuclease